MALEDHKMRFVKAEVAELQKSNPKLRFAQAWELVRKTHPELFGASPGTDSRAGVAAELKVAAMRAEQEKWGTFTVQGGFCTNIWTGEVVS